MVTRRRIDIKFSRDSSGLISLDLFDLFDLFLPRHGLVRVMSPYHSHITTVGISWRRAWLTAMRREVRLHPNECHKYDVEAGACTSTTHHDAHRNTSIVSVLACGRDEGGPGLGGP